MSAVDLSIPERGCKPRVNSRWKEGDGIPSEPPGSQLKAVHSLATSLRVTTAPIGMLQEMLTFHIAPILRCLTDDTS
jgi:hypothetical protein